MHDQRQQTLRITTILRVSLILSSDHQQDLPSHADSSTGPLPSRTNKASSLSKRPPSRDTGSVQAVCGTYIFIQAMAYRWIRCSIACKKVLHSGHCTTSINLCHAFLQPPNSARTSIHRVSIDGHSLAATQSRRLTIRQRIQPAVKKTVPRVVVPLHHPPPSFRQESASPAVSTSSGATLSLLIYQTRGSSSPRATHSVCIRTDLRLYIPGHSLQTRARQRAHDVRECLSLFLRKHYFQKASQPTVE